VFTDQYPTLYFELPTSSEEEEDSDNPEDATDPNTDSFLVGSNVSVSRCLPA
jgi:hypothetical protein